MPINVALFSRPVYFSWVHKCVDLYVSARAVSDILFGDGPLYQQHSKLSNGELHKCGNATLTLTFLVESALTTLDHWRVVWMHRGPGVYERPSWKVKLTSQQFIEHFNYLQDVILM